MIEIELAEDQFEIGHVSSDSSIASRPNHPNEELIVNRNDNNSINSENSESNGNTIKKITIRLYAVFLHIFIFSVFESIFFWYYIIVQENEALERQFSELIMISNLVCVNIDLDLDPFYDYLSEQRVNFNNRVSVNNTFLLNGFLLGLIILFNFFMKIMKLNVFKQNKNILKNHFLIFILLFIYEYIFFSNIIYNYKPKSIAEITKKFFNECLN
ncbi:hypothetical protein CL656_01665 [bacterium]|nr:hypothetical protein [bacterium]|tara:strand:+ start:203 stop:844 length:642 start_codon:yes stop_codon:yes gene_type:complete